LQEVKGTKGRGGKTRPKTKGRKQAGGDHFQEWNAGGVGGNKNRRTRGGESGEKLKKSEITEEKKGTNILKTAGAPGGELRITNEQEKKKTKKGKKG